MQSPVWKDKWTKLREAAGVNLSIRHSLSLTEDGEGEFKDGCSRTLQRSKQPGTEDGLNQWRSRGEGGMSQNQMVPTFTWLLEAGPCRCLVFTRALKTCGSCLYNIHGLLEETCTYHKDKYRNSAPKTGNLALIWRVNQGHIAREMMPDQRRAEYKSHQVLEGMLGVIATQTMETVWANVLWL